MTWLKSFVNSMASALQMGPAPLQCSRVDLAADDSDESIIVLLRTLPELSERVLSAPYFQYPLPMLVNTGVVMWDLTQCPDAAFVAPALNELIPAVIGERPLSEQHGTIIDHDTETFYVPIIDQSVHGSDSSQAWKSALLNPAYTVTDRSRSGMIDFHIVHLPDYPITYLSDNQLQQIARITIGWNYCRFIGRDYVKEAIQRIIWAATIAETIVTYE